MAHSVNSSITLSPGACLRKAALACQRTLFGEQVGKGREEG